MWKRRGEERRGEERRGEGEGGRSKESKLEMQTTAIVNERLPPISSVQSATQGSCQCHCGHTHTVRGTQLRQAGRKQIQQQK